MAKKNRKFLLGAAVIGVAIAGGIYYLNKCKQQDDTWEDDFEDFEDDFEDDLDEEDDVTPVAREYVTIPKDSHTPEKTPEDASADETDDTDGQTEDIAEEKNEEDTTEE